MKLSISNIAWTNEYDEEMYGYLSDSGFSGLEIAPTRIIPNNPYDHLKLAENYTQKIKLQYNLEICSMQSILFGKTERLFGSTEERQELTSYTKKAIDFAKTINCHNLVFGSPKNRIIEDKSQYPLAISFFKELGSYAFKKNTTLSIEANPEIYGTNFINHTEQAFQLVKDVNQKGFMVNLDLGTIIENNENLSLVADNFSLINHIHISEPNLFPVEKRNLHNDLFVILREVNYDKFISIEMKNTNDISATKKTINYIKEVFNVN